MAEITLGTTHSPQTIKASSSFARLVTARDWLLGKRIRILTYHSISNAPGDRLSIEPAQFSTQMEYLANRGFDVISLKRACELLGSDSKGLQRKIVLTFDDGYRDFMTTAAPILQRMGFSATLFVVFGCVGGTAKWSSHNPNRALLSAKEIQQVRAMGFALGSHTMSHSDLTALTDRALASELGESREALAATGESFAPFAYPGGRFGEHQVAAVQRSGYDCAVIVGGRWGNGSETDRMLLRREPVLASDSLEWFTRRVSGYYEWHYLWARARGVQTR